MTKCHKVFTSYHHANDENYKNIFELRFGNKYGVVIPGGVQMGDIDPELKTQTIRQRIRDEYLRDTSVTVVLIGKETWKRKHVDWEISSSIRATKLNPRSGLLGLFLPSHPAYGKGRYVPGTIPPRLYDNVKCEYAVLADWTEDPEKVQDLVHKAYLRKSKVDPDNARDLFGKNRSSDQWS